VMREKNGNCVLIMNDRDMRKNPLWRPCYIRF